MREFLYLVNMHRHATQLRVSPLLLFSPLDVNAGSLRRLYLRPSSSTLSTYSTCQATTNTYSARVVDEEDKPVSESAVSARQALVRASSLPRKQTTSTASDTTLP